MEIYSAVKKLQWGFNRFIVGMRGNGLFCLSNDVKCHICKNPYKNIIVTNWTDLERKSKYMVKIAEFKNIKTKNYE